MNRSVRILALAITLGLIIGVPLAVRPVAAHEHRSVGYYNLTVGWRDEPPTVGFVNGLDLGIQYTFPNNGTKIWVTGASMNATLTTGRFTSTRHSVEPQFGRPGWYTFNVIPTRPGVYTVKLNGTLDSTRVNVSVDLDPVAPASDLAFPIADPTPSDLQGRLDAANAVIAGLQAQMLASLGVAIVGVVLGAIAILYAVRTSQRQGKSP